MSTPDLQSALAYLAASDSGHSWSDADVQDALDAESVAQANVVRIPSGAFPKDLEAALMRRVARHLQLRTLPLGLETATSEVSVGFARVGGSDPEVRRLEAPYRKWVVG